MRIYELGPEITNKLKSIPQEELLAFSQNFLLDHKYFKTLDIAISYLRANYFITRVDSRYPLMKKVLMARFKYTIHQLLKDNSMTRFNTLTYKSQICT